MVTQFILKLGRYWPWKTYRATLRLVQSSGMKSAQRSYTYQFLGFDLNSNKRRQCGDVVLRVNCLSESGVGSEPSQTILLGTHRGRILLCQQFQNKVFRNAVCSLSDVIPSLIIYDPHFLFQALLFQLACYFCKRL